MSFLRKHPLLATLILIPTISVAIVLVIMLGLGIFTRHNQSVKVPKVYGLPFEQVCKILDENNLRYEVVDSVYADGIAPGTVLEITPKEGSEIKPNRLVFLTMKAFYPKQVVIPDVSNVSERQARAVLGSLGFPNIHIQYTQGSHDDLVQCVKLRNGKAVKPGTRLFLNTPLIVVVSQSPEGHHQEDEVFGNDFGLPSESDSISNKRNTAPTGNGDLDDDESWW